MDYSKIPLLKNHYKLQRKEFAAILGVSVTGFDHKLKEETFTVKDIELIASHLKVPISYFFGETYSLGEIGMPNDSCRECIKKEAVIEKLEDQLKESQEEIARLNREIGRNAPEKRAKAG